MKISFDEWNVWYHERKRDAERMKAWDWPEAPRLLEDIYNFEDVLQVGCILNTFIRRVRRGAHRLHRPARQRHRADHDRARRRRPGARRSTGPLCFASKHGRGTALQLAVEVPTYDAAAADRVPWLDIAGVHDADAGTLTFFAVNRHATETMEADVALERFAAKSVEHTLIRHDDLEASNTREAPEHRIAGRKATARALGGKGMTLNLPPHSYSMVRVTLY